jgi:hypothetical protein
MPRKKPEKEHDSAFATLTPSTPAEMYNNLTPWLQKKGCILRFDYSAKLQSFHSLYTWGDPTPIKGIKFPNGFSTAMPADEDYLQGIQKTLLGIASGQDGDGLTAEEAEFALPLVIYRQGRASDIVDHVLGLQTLKARYHKKIGGGLYEQGIAFKPGSTLESPASSSPIFAYLPEKKWFEKEIQDLKFEDIVKIFPEYEAKMMKLILGRAVVGRSGTVHPGSAEVIHHGFRKAGVVIGEPGVGKTITLNGVLDAMKYLGYEVTAMGDFGSRFNQGEIITSHLAYNDDLTTEGLKSMLTAHSFKSVVTGGTERVENKGTDAVEVVANTVILANCNEWKPELTYDLDSGAISRLAPIATYRLYELEEMSEEAGHDVHPASHIRWLCKKYNVEPRTLYILLLRDCADFFMEHCKGEQGEDIHFYSEALLPYMRVQMHKAALESFLRFMLLAYAIRKRAAKGTWLPELTLNSFEDAYEATRFLMIDKRADNLRSLMKQDWEYNNRPSRHPYWAQRKVLITSVDKAWAALQESKASKDVALSVEMVLDVLRLRDGFNMGKKMPYVVRTWESVKGECKKIYALADTLISQIPAEEAEAICNSMTVCDSQWLYDPDYDPKKVGPVTK